MAYSMQMQFSHCTGATRSHKLHMNISGPVDCYNGSGQIWLESTHLVMLNVQISVDKTADKGEDQ